MSQDELKLGTIIKQICDERNISVRQLERESGLAERTISRWDTNMPSFDKVLAVAKFLNMSTDDLVNYPENKKFPTAVSNEELSYNQIELINDIKNLTEDELSALLLFVKTFLSDR